MDFSVTEEQRLIVESSREFARRELRPHAEAVEAEGRVSAELARQIRARAVEAGVYPAAMPPELGGAGLDWVTLALMDFELGRESYALHNLVMSPYNILRACSGSQIEEFLLPTVRGERIECIAMTEPEAGSDLRSMRTTARRNGADFEITGTKHFISRADVADYAIVFAATGAERDPAGRRKKITCFLVDMDSPGFVVRDGYRSVSHRGYRNFILEFDRCRVKAENVLGEEHGGFAIAGTWLGSTRLQVAARCVGRARWALEIATEWAATREQFGQPIGRFQGVSFKLADMATEVAAAELLTLSAAWKMDEGRLTDADAAMAKLYASEVLAKVADEAIQIHGGMGVMEELPLARIWRDARVERIWDGTSEIQRHIVARSLLRPHERATRSGT